MTSKDELIEYICRNAPGFITPENVEVIAENELLAANLEINMEEALILVGRNLGVDMSKYHSSEQTAKEVEE